MVLEGQQAEALDVGAEFARRGIIGEISAAGLSIQSSGKPGSVQAYVTSFDRAGKHVFDIPLKDANDPNNSRGGNHPVNLQGKNHAVLFLKNTESPDPTPKLRTAVVELWFPGGTYSFPMQTVAQGETISLDITQVRDAQVKDSFGNALPKDLQMCQVQWYGRDNVHFIGRLVVYDPELGVSSSFSCAGVCPCPATFSNGFISPGSIRGIAGSQVLLSVTEQDSNCSGTIFSYNVTASASFSTSNASVVTVSGSTGTLGGPGTATLIATWGTQSVTDNGPCLPREICGDRCSVVFINTTAQASVEVIPNITSLSPAVGTPGAAVTVTVNGSGFGSGCFLSASTSNISILITQRTSANQVIASFNIAAST
ncbi:MAG: hypothetical protein ACREDR_28870, partial [Blastocatellia bacterium]